MPSVGLLHAGGVIVYDYKTDSSHQFTDTTMGPIGINDLNYCGARTFPVGPVPLDGIALTPDTNTYAGV
jgi:hypothetical protein